MKRYYSFIYKVTQFIHEVFYVPPMNVNFISIGQLLQNQYDIWFFDTYCAIYDKPPSKRLISKVEINKNRYFLLVLEVPTFHSLQLIQFPVKMNPGYGTRDSVIFPSRVSISCTNTQWSKDYLLFINNPTLVRIVSLVNIIGTIFPLPHLEPKSNLSQFIQTSVDPCKPNPQEAVFIFLPLLMVLAGKHGFISSGIKQRPSPSSKSSRLSLEAVSKVH